MISMCMREWDGGACSPCINRNPRNGANGTAQIYICIAAAVYYCTMVPMSLHIIFRSVAQCTRRLNRFHTFHRQCNASEMV